MTGADRVVEIVRTVLPTPHGTFGLVGFRDVVTGAEHLALLSPRGSLGSAQDATTVRVHSECLTGEAFGSLRCDCGAQLDRSLAEVADRGGVVVYLRGHEGRGVGLLQKLRAYGLQDVGLDTVEAQVALGLPVDGREYGAAVAILRHLAVTRVVLLTGNPDKVGALRAGGIEVVEVRPIAVPPTADNSAYLRAKRERLGHAWVEASMTAADLLGC